MDVLVPGAPGGRLLTSWLGLPWKPFLGHSVPRGKMDLLYCKWLPQGGPAFQPHLQPSADWAIGLWSLALHF